MSGARVVRATLAVVLVAVAVPAAAARRSCEKDLEKVVTKQAVARLEAAAKSCTQAPSGICFFVRSKAIRAKQLKRCRGEAVARLFGNRCVARETDCLPGAVGSPADVAACVSCAVPAEIDCLAAALFAPGNAPASCGTAVFPTEDVRAPAALRAAPAPVPAAKKRGPSTARCLKTIVRELKRAARASLRQALRGFAPTAALRSAKLARACGKRLPDGLQYRGCPGLLGCPSDLNDTREGFEACAGCLVHAAAAAISARVRPGLCGNATVDGPGETCETHDVCTPAGLHCGAPGSDIRQCTCYQTCGDGVRQDHEECDPTATPTGCDAESGCASEGAAACTCVTHTRFALVANTGDDTLSVVAVEADTGRLRHLGFALTGEEPVGVAVAGRGRFAYTANRTTNNVSLFTLDPVTGVISRGPTVVSGLGPEAIAAHPGEGFLYVVNGFDKNVAAWAIDAAGGLVPVAGSPFAVGGTTPSSLAIDPTGRFAYVGDAGAEAIVPFAIAGDGGLVARTPHPAPGGPTALAPSADGRWLYAALADGQVGVYFIDPTTGVLATRPPATAGTDPVAVATDPEGRFVFVANEGSGDVHTFRVDAATGALAPAATLALGTAPVGLGMEPSGRFLHVALRDENEVIVLAVDAATGALAPVDRLRVRLGPARFAFTRGGTPVTFAPAFVAVANRDSSDVTLHAVDPATGQLGAGAATTVGAEPLGIALHPNGRLLYTADRVSRTVTALSLDPVAGTLTVVGSDSDTTDGGKLPRRIAVVPSGLFAVVGNEDTSLSTFLLDPTTGVPMSPSTKMSQLPSGLALDPAGRFLFVVSGATNSITLWTVGATNGGLTPFDDEATGSTPAAVAVHPSGRFVYAANRGDDTVSQYAVSPTGTFTPLGTVDAGDEPAALAVDPRGRFAYAGNHGSNDLSAYAIGADGRLTAVGETLPVTAEPTALAVDPSGAYLYVASATFSNVLVYAIDQTTGALVEIGNADAGSQPSDLVVIPSIR